MLDDPAWSRGDLEIPPPVYRPQRQADGTWRLVLIAGGFAALLLVVLGVWAIGGHGGNGTVPVVQAASGPVRVKPENPGGMQFAGAGESLGSEAAGTPEALAPAPETPAPQALRAEQQQAKATVPPVNPPPAAPTPAVQATPPLSPSAKVASIAPPAPATTRPEAKSAHGATEVQLAAMDTEAGAKEEWARLARRMPAMLDGRHPDVIRVERDGHALWRLRTGGFADAAQAAAFCAQMRAKGAGCAVATF